MLDAVHLISGYIFYLFGSIHRKTNIFYNLFGIIINSYSLLFHANIIFREKNGSQPHNIMNKHLNNHLKLHLLHEQTPKQPP
jgi:hypothetical protein